MGAYERTEFDAVTKRRRCEVDGCARNARSGRSPYCEAHYYRIRRTGQIDLREKHIKRRPDAYNMVKAKGHPLARANDQVYEHRKVYYDTYGDGPFVCHWCGTEVNWHNMHIDHLNEIKCDNRPENLNAACVRCNTGRSKEKARISRNEKQGRFIEFDGMRMVISDWSRLLGINTTTIKWRLDKGWPIDKVLSREVKSTGPKRRMGV